MAIVKSKIGLNIGTPNSAQFFGFVSDVQVDATVLTTKFNPKTNTTEAFTTLEWKRPEYEQLPGETYSLYRSPLTNNNQQQLPISDPVFSGDSETTKKDKHKVANSAIVTDPTRVIKINESDIVQQDGVTTYTYDYTIPPGTQGWYFYALVIKYKDLSKVVVPLWSVWESNVGPGNAIAVPNLRAEPRPGYKKVYLKWDPVSTGGVAGYKVYYSEQENADKWALTQWKVKPYYAELISGTSTTVRGLVNGKKYYFKVRAVDNTGNEGPFSEEIFAVPLDDSLAPERISPSELIVTDSGIGGTVEVDWTAYATREDLEDDLTTYEIYYSPQIFSDTSLATWYKTVSVSSRVSTVEVSGLQNDIQYWFAVIPVDEAGNAYRFSLNLKPAVPTAPTSITFSEPVTVVVHNEVEVISGVPAPHVIYGVVRLPMEAIGQVRLDSVEVSVKVVLSAIGNAPETIRTMSDELGFWSVNLGNLTFAEWNNDDYVEISLKDWNSPYVGYGNLNISVVEGAQRIDIIMEDSSLRPPVLMSPVAGGVCEYPIFRIYSESQDENLRFKIEVSDDNFRTIVKAFDESSKPFGWSREVSGGNRIAVYRSYQEDRFVNGENYQWRAYAWNGIRYSAPSNMAQFRVVAEQLDRISVPWSFEVNDPDKLVELSGIQTDIGRFEGIQEANGATITDSLPVFEWELTRNVMNNVHFRIEIDTSEAFDNSDGRLRTYESKEDIRGFEYSIDNGRTWLPFTKVGAPPGVKKFRFVFSNNLEVE